METSVSARPPGVVAGLEGPRGRGRRQATPSAGATRTMLPTLGVNAGAEVHPGHFRLAQAAELQNEGGAGPMRRPLGVCSRKKSSLRVAAAAPEYLECFRPGAIRARHVGYYYKPSGARGAEKSAELCHAAEISTGKHSPPTACARSHMAALAARCPVAWCLAYGS